MDRTLSFYEVRDALALPGCALCRLRAKSVERFVDGLLWESVTDPAARRELRRARGFCPDHARAFVRPGAALGTAIITHDVISNLLQVLGEARYEALPLLSLRRAQEALDPTQPAAATANLVARLAPQTTCPACKQAETMEHVYTTTLLDGLRGEDGLVAAFHASDGLCLPHLRRALALLRDHDAYGTLIDAQRSIWERLCAELSEFIRKKDYRFRNEPWGEEGNAWLRGVAALAGSGAEEGWL
jgi:Family of unknown function (DUF6062)